MRKIKDWIQTKKLRVAIGTDHGGFQLKENLRASLLKKEIDTIDIGAHELNPDDDYPDFGKAVASLVAEGKAHCGILICRSGVGMSVVANRTLGVRAAIADNEKLAKLSRTHNCSNVLVIPGDVVSEKEANKIVEAWLSTPFSGEERHARRLARIDAITYDEIPSIRSADPELAEMLDNEVKRQTDGIELIASENFASAAVRQAQGTVLTNKYAEGYPGKRYYNGCEVVDEVEALAIKRACELFGAEAANVQPHAGSQANMAAYFALVQPGDTVLAMSLDHGGHLTHGHPMNFSGMLYDIVPYGVSRETETIDYDEIARLADAKKPKLIIAGASAYPRIIDFVKLREIADSVGAKLMVDMAHIAGLVAAGLHPSPVPYADVVTTTTHKTLRGPRSGLILCKEEFLKPINSKVFPGLQGGPMMHTIAAKAVCFKEAMAKDFKAYQKQTVLNAAKLAEEIARNGFRIVSGGTDNHLMLVDLRPKHVTGKLVAGVLDKAAITVNKNMIPFDPEKPFVTSGVRIGTPAVTTRGMKERDMVRIAEFMDRAISVQHDDEALGAIAAEVRDFMKKFPMPAV
ncbi:MAG: RpiB/LacA/LacB family sugar-phosphate isomerase [Kiritimatiellaeota bacterium]|nr:RpiB/LacA/LacB family sugar-phosphate isomerase [Kiritimatiellota bacterium]